MVQVFIDGELVSEHEVEGSDPNDAIFMAMFIHDPFQTVRCADCVQCFFSLVPEDRFGFGAN